MRKKLLLGMVLGCMSVAMLGCGASEKTDTKVTGEVTEDVQTGASEEETEEAVSEEVTEEIVIERDPDLYYGFVHYFPGTEGMDECMLIEPFWDYFLNAPIMIPLEEAKGYGIDVDGVIATEEENGYSYDTMVSFTAEVENYQTYDEIITVSNVMTAEVTCPDYDLSTVDGVEKIDSVVYLQLDPNVSYDEEMIDFVNIYTDFAFQDAGILEEMTEDYGITKDTLMEQPFYTATYYVVNQGTEFSRYQLSDLVAVEGEVPYESFKDTISIMVDEFDTDGDGEIESFANIMSTDGERFYNCPAELVKTMLGTDEIVGEYTIQAYELSSENSEWPTYVINEFIQ